MLTRCGNKVRGIDSMLQFEGYEREHGIPPEDYEDYCGRKSKFNQREFARELEMGNLPPGLIVRDETGRRYRVCGEYGVVGRTYLVEV